jgi:hypothetical protein
MADCKLTPTQSIEVILFILFALVFFSSHFTLIRSISHHSNLLGCCGSHIFFVQTSLGRMRGTLLKPGGAPDCRWSRQNWTLQFAKPEYPVSTVLSMGFRFLFISCGNTFCRLRWGIDYFKHVKHEGWKL